jgi:hypothetical protein
MISPNDPAGGPARQPKQEPRMHRRGIFMEFVFNATDDEADLMLQIVAAGFISVARDQIIAQFGPEALRKVAARAEMKTWAADVPIGCLEKQGFDFFHL